MLLKTKATSNEEAKAAQFIYQRFKQDATARQEAVKIAKLELKRAETLLAFYEIRSPVPGVIRKITHHQGEAVRQYETLFLIAPADR